MTTTKGFTLIELMIVVVMIAIITAIALPSYQQYIRRADEASAQQQMQQIATDLEKYKSRQFNYLSYSLPTELTYLPKGSTASTAKYTFSVRDGNDTNKSLSQTGVTGRSWVISATAASTQPKLNSFVMTSLGQKCKKQGSTIDLACTGADPWTD